MKKTMYTKPHAEMVLLTKEDVIRTSGIARAADDTNGLPTVSWKS